MMLFWNWADIPMYDVGDELKVEGAEEAKVEDRTTMYISSNLFFIQNSIWYDFDIILYKDKL